MGGGERLRLIHIPILNREASRTCLFPHQFYASSCFFSDLFILESSSVAFGWCLIFVSWALKGITIEYIRSYVQGI